MVLSSRDSNETGREALQVLIPIVGLGIRNCLLDVYHFYQLSPT